MRRDQGLHRLEEKQESSLSKYILSYIHVYKHVYIGTCTLGIFPTFPIGTKRRVKNCPLAPKKAVSP
jgi:hypothetical protein